MLRWLALMAGLVLLPTATSAQASGEDSLSAARDAASSSVGFPLSLLIPSGIRQGYAVRDFIVSPAFGSFARTASPEEVFDEIYLTAIEYTHGDLPTGLLAASFGAFEHENIPVNLFGLEIRIPLTSESHARFQTRQSHLPRDLYHTGEDDRDKLQHFFASGWLKEAVGMDWLANIGGQLVELGESLFVIGSTQDPRDIHANQDGIRFAIEAERDLGSLPSESLTPNPQVGKQ